MHNYHYQANKAQYLYICLLAKKYFGRLYPQKFDILLNTIYGYTRTKKFPLKGSSKEAVYRKAKMMH